LGLQASSLLSKDIRRLNLGRELVVVVDEFIEVVVSGAGVVVSHIIKLRIEVVGDMGEVVFKELIICVRGVTMVEKISILKVNSNVVIKIRKSIVEVESIQGLGSSD